YKTIAVIGPDADNLDALVGNYNGTPSHPVSIVDGIRERLTHSRIIYAEGTGLIGPVSKPIPETVLYTDTSRKEQGLKAEYFPNLKLEGSPALVRTDHTVDFAWGDSGVSPELSRNFSVRWTGVLVPPRNGDYLIGFTGQDGYRLWVDGKPAVEDWTSHHPA